jgi:hypothetical protein
VQIKENVGIEKAEYGQHLDRLARLVENLLQRFESFATRTGVNDTASRYEGKRVFECEDARGCHA